MDGAHEMKKKTQLYFLQITGMRVMDKRKETDKMVKETGQERQHLPLPESFPQPWDEKRIKVKMLNKTEKGGEEWRKVERRGD